MLLVETRIFHSTAGPAKNMQHPVIEEIESSGETALADGTRVPIHGNVGVESGKIMRRAIENTRPRLAVEVALAFGM